MTEALKILAANDDLQITLIVVAIIIGIVICSFFKWAAHAFRARKDK